ncbi:MAG: GntR family transcriptional regulator [Oscillospiraceae bacterium]|nr:GntR family transcriptional regulator [Oscillospiraceae bacterium]
MREHKSISIADQIFEQLERDILAGRYPKGEVLSELSLAKQLGVSRTPVREAIRRLEQEKILEETSRGLTVVGISHEDMLDMYEIRLHIEGLAARRAAERITDEELAAMRETLDLQRFYVEKGGENSSMRIKNLDSQFHEQLYSASGSKAYCDTLLSLHKKITKFRMASVSKQSRALQSLEEHEAIFAALSARDGEAAAKAATAHTLNARDRIAPMEI